MRGARVVAVATLVVAGCGGAQGSGGVGRHFGYISGTFRAVDTSTERATIEFDVAEFLAGEAANDAAEADGVIEEGEGVPNDYYIRNPDESVDALAVSPDVTVTRVRCDAGCEDGAPGDFDAFASSFVGGSEPSLMEGYRGSASQYWIILDDGEVAAIDEQYLP